MCFVHDEVDFLYEVINVVADLEIRSIDHNVCRSFRLRVTICFDGFFLFVCLLDCWLLVSLSASVTASCMIADVTSESPSLCVHTTCRKPATHLREKKRRQLLLEEDDSQASVM